MDTPQPPPADSKPDDTPLQTQVVNNIPIHEAAGPTAPAPVQPTDENKIMRAVGDQLAKEDQPKPKNHFFSKPAQQPKSAPAQPTQVPEQVPAQKTPPNPAAKPTKKPKSSVPVLAIAIAVVVTAGLIALAVSTLN